VQQAVQTGAREPLMPAPQPAPAAGPQVVADPAADSKSLATQGSQRPSLRGAGEVGAHPSDVYSEDWWGHTRPILELHGYFRTRAELFHNFGLGRHNAPGDIQQLWAQPLDQSYGDSSGTVHNVNLCGPSNGVDAQGRSALQPCYDKTQSGANVRFRINPELHISDNLRIMSQVDMLDNLVLGSTPDAYTIKPGNSGNIKASGNGYGPGGYNGYAPLGVFSTTQGPPTAGVNSFRNSIDVKRVWAEYMTPVGQLRFGRMPSHWGLGMVANSGDGIDSDYQTTQDRIMFVTGIKSLDLYFGGAWDFVSTGPTSASQFDVYGGQPYNTGNLTNVNEWVAFAARRTNPDMQRLALSRGDVVVNGGTYWVYRSQLLDVQSTQTPLTFAGDDGSTADRGLERRNAWAIIPDLWVQFLWRKLRIEAEGAAIVGDVEQLPGQTDRASPYKIRQYGVTAQSEYKAVEDKLRLGFGFGWASGDPWVTGLSPGNSGLQPEQNGGRGPISTFHFHPDYRVDLIFFRHILSRVEGAYYFRPSVDYDFLKNANGQKFGGGAAIIWSRASEFIQTPGHKRDLGVELDLSLYYQAKDGSLNDDPDRTGGFYTMLQYGVFFPLGGLSYLPGEQTNLLPNWDVSTAQTLRLFLGVVY
jgi:uncharacterized protein (TIGR04551 family)